MSLPYRPEIDGLRAVAVLPVILFHAGIGPFTGGYLGVDVFLVLSGYLITAILLADLGAGRFSLWRFYERRARRILPALTVVCLSCLPFAWAWMTPEELRDFGQSLVAVATFSSNVLFWRESDYFGPVAEEKPLLHTWSLAVEEQFYILFPLLLLVLWRRGPRHTGLVLGAAAVLSLGLAEWGWRHRPEANFYLAPTRAWELLAGAICALALGRRPALHFRGQGSIALAGLGLIVGSMLVFDGGTPVPSLFALLPVGGTVRVMLCACPGTRAGAALAARPLVAIGLISYSAYLWHQPLLAFARLQFVLPVTPALMGTLALLSLGLAAITWRYVEQPFRGGRMFLPLRGQVFAAAGGALALIAVLGIAGHLSRGFPGRIADGQAGRAVAQLATLNRARDAGIGKGTCHAPWDVGAALPGFLAAWDCVPAAPGPRLAVFGDSHAADIAWALRLAGAPVLQMTGAACPLVARAGERPYCPALRARFRAALRPGDWVVLANRFEPWERDAAALEAMLRDWRGAETRVVLVMPRPEYPQLARALGHAGLTGAAALRPDHGAGRTVQRAAARLPTSARDRMIDTVPFLCGDSPCRAVVQGTPLYADATHLSRAGAARLGTGLREALHERGYDVAVFTDGAPELAKEAPGGL